MDTHTPEIVELQEQLTAKIAELSQLSAKHSMLTDELSRVKSQNAAGTAVLNNLKSIGKNYERPNRSARVTLQCKESYTTPSTAEFSALLAERKDYKNCFEALSLEN